jgi:antitoxin CptB
MAEPSTLRLKRLRHRSRYRGCRESDLIFAAFAERHLDGLGPWQLDRYEALLDESDADLLAWITGARPPPPAHDHDVLALLRAVRLDPHRPIDGG